jgi:hypothetical protein
MAIEVTAARLRTRSLSEVDAALAVELAGVSDQVLLHRVVRAALDRLPRRDAERITALAAMERVTPGELRRALAARRATTDHLDAIIALLATMALVTVSGPEIQITVPRCVREVVLAGREYVRYRGQPLPVGVE